MFAGLAAYVLISGMSQQFVAAQITQTENHSMCNCVIFRLDDVQDTWLHSAQTQIMNLFISKDQSLSVGIIMNETGNDQMILQKIKEGQSKGLFEMAIHGLNHVDYTKLSEQEQKKTLDLANTKMQTLFGVKSNVFIPPYDLFNNSTLVAMADSRIGILSAALGPPNDNHFIWSPSDSSEPYSIFQFPETVGFMDEVDGVWQKVSNSAILDSIHDGIAKRGYAVVVLHPQNFVKTENGQFVDVMDSTQVSNLSNLIDSVLAKKIRITTFENISGSDPPQNQMQPISDSVKTRNEFLKEKRIEINNMIHSCHMEIKNAVHNHKQIAHECKAKIMKAKEDYKNIHEQLKSEFKEIGSHLNRHKHNNA